ncbi:hypothetical protein PsAD46_03786 [Pseudovibrio sp. Ad46]|uniref:hypothetical protein n=1 Tax=unclassified Pseudovibrio TaxID=2627060 RepID=UPI0007AE4633|nr:MULTISPECIES: hypothetical protein [unclassified Pseudovibrio]KZK80745.1 hypothetical protein PsAD46_03786 [Pseudovibrio sp. Ad46]KZK96584.1 hypothetical protein PsAD5_02784 [Pseudovibrio sp. Ad5]
MTGNQTWQQGEAQKLREFYFSLKLNTSEIVSTELTKDSVDELKILRDQIEGPLAKFLGDRAYDGASIRQELKDRFARFQVNMLTPKTVVLNPEIVTDAIHYRIS